MSNLEGIAIVGIAARFPGARDAEELWRNLRDGIETVSFFSEEELAAAGVDPALLADPRYVRAKGALADADLFDAAFFGFTPREAEAMDPQHRVFLECAWEALEDAACDPEHSSGRIGVWAGSGVSSYLISNLLPNEEKLASFGGLQVLLLNDRDFLATRASYELNLKGPSVSVQTACSTSLVAVHMASQSLLGGECDLALAGGVSISSPLRTGYLYQEGSVMSPDGCCRAFDASAGGAVEGNGCGVVALKRLADAVAEGDRIYAVIRGSAVNNDGSAKIGFTAPSVEGQAEVISEALMMAGVEPETVGYVEAHGSGTPLGDPIEVAALTQAFRAAGAQAQGFCAIGSIKTNFGHCNTAAGVAGLIKAALALKHETLPPSLHFETPNPQIAFAGSPFYVCDEARPWQGSPRRAGVSSFGLGGTNAHVVLEEAPAPEPADEPSRPAQLLVLSARTPSALAAASARLEEHLNAHPELSLADVAWTLQVGRKAFEHRQIRVGGDWIAGKREGRPAVVFLFPGLGDQHVDMARELYETEPLFREQVDLCAGKLGFDLLSVLFSPGPRSERKAPDLRSMLRRSAETGPLHETVYAQPACFVIEYALGRLLMSWGIEPTAMIGYSLGEYVAACFSGALSLDDALALVEQRAKLIQDLPGGAMLAVPLPEEEVRPLLDGLSLSATNGPHFCVVGGPSDEVDALERKLGVSCIRLRTTHAFHSAMMEPAVAPFTEIARQVRMQAPRIPFVSNVTGTWITADDLADPAYWARHMRSPVRFAEGIGELLREPDRVFLEVGPGATLGTLVKQHPDAAGTGASRITIPTLREGADLEAVLEAVGRLWIAGVEVDWARFHNNERRRRVPLPTYPFERQRYWIDPPKGTVRKMADVEDWFWVPAWRQAPLKAAAPEPGRWLIFLDGQGVGERIADRLRGDGHEVFTVPRGQAHDLHESLPDRILHLQGLDEEDSPFEALVSLTRLTQALSALDKPVRLLLAASGLHELADGDPIHFHKAAVLGALKVVHQELPRVTCSSVDAAPGPGLEERLIAETFAADPVVALRGRQRWVRGFERVGLQETESLAGTWLIAEADHGPGRAIADYLVRQGAQVVTGLPAAVSAGRLRGAFYTGVPQGGGLIQLKTPEGLRAALDPVVRGAEELLAALDPSIPVFLCSTTTAITGGLGQLDLAAAGACLEALAVRHAAEGRPVMAVHWDPYQWGGWLVTGVAGGMAGLSNEEVQANLAAHGVTAAKSARALRHLLGSPFSRLIVSAQDLPGLIAETDSVTAETLLAQMSHGGEKAQRPGLSTAYEPPQNELEERLAAIWQDLFGIEPIGRDDDFLELGGHSLLAIQVTTQAQSLLGVDLPVTALFEAPTIAALAKAVRRARGEDDPEEMEALLAMIEGLSPEEAAAKLAELEA
ncbi:MAG: type I polyketide synthase [Thermoanaerobaculia bacterium]